MTVNFQTKTEHISNMTPFMINIAYTIYISIMLVCINTADIIEECSVTRPEWIPIQHDKLIQACFKYDKSTNIPTEFSIVLDINTYILNTNNYFPSPLSDGKWDLLDTKTNAVVYECCGHETILNIPSKAKQLTTLKNFIINFFLDSLLPPHPEQKRYAMHYYFVDETFRQSVIKAGTTDNICNKNEYFFNVPCDVWDRAQLYPSNNNIIPPNYINKNAILPGMGNHLINPSFASFGSEMTLVIGIYDKILNFFVPSISIQFLTQYLQRATHKNDECYPLQLNEKQMFSFEGYYPTQICFRLKNENEVTVLFNKYEYFESPESDSIGSESESRSSESVDISAAEFGSNENDYQKQYYDPLTKQQPVVVHFGQKTMEHFWAVGIVFILCNVTLCVIYQKSLNN
eukprot:488607_1